MAFNKNIFFLPSLTQLNLYFQLILYIMYHILDAMLILSNIDEFRMPDLAIYIQLPLIFC